MPCFSNRCCADRVSSAAITLASRNTRSARNVMSSRFPIGVATMKRLIFQPHRDLHRVAELLLQIRLQLGGQALLQLAGALAADAVGLADLLQRLGRIVEQPLAEDRLLAAFERGVEGFELGAQQ